MRRVKVISEPTDLVPILHAFDAPVKREVFQRILGDWRTMADVREEFGDEGADALTLFEKTRLVETRWAPTPEGAQRSFRSYYTNFQIAFQCTAEEMGDILAVASMPRDAFEALEQEIVHMVESDMDSQGRIAEKLGISTTRLKSLVKRSARVTAKGHVVALVDEPGPGSG